ncbi:MAG TPA: thiamine pyrophosphate-dependent enzyme, partial [Bacillota bacterium]|nr:thiamine pyrophosphate-dependent enzyme [Bacillota bacterium]
MNVKTYSKDQLLAWYETMYKMRRFEEEVFEFYKQGLMPGLAHLYMGEEAVATGVCAALNDSDFIGSTHRGHGHLIARGADIKRMMAEILGKVDGYCRGKGGSMHIMAMDKGILGANGIVGGGIP